MVGDTYSSDVFRGEVGFGEGLTRDCALAFPDFERVMLNPAGLGEDLTEILLNSGGDLAILSKEDGAGAGGALIEGKDE